MTITGPYEFNGIPLPACYGRLDMVAVYGTTSGRASMSLFANQSAADSGISALKAVPVTFVYDGASGVSVQQQAIQAYKALPEFSSWV